MTFEKAAEQYNISPTTIQKWKKRLHSKNTRNIKPTKIVNEALLKDVQTHPDSYHYERARRLGCSASGVCVALKRLGITQKKDFKASKSLSDQKD